MPTLSIAELRQFVADILIAAGAPEDITAIVAESLIGADLAGHGSHGVMKLPSYLRDIQRGKLDPAARPRILRDSPTTAVMDGSGGFGHLSARVAVDLCAQKAAAAGLAAVSVARTHHTGRLGGWSERLAASGFIGMLMGGEGQGPYLVAPYRGRSGALATNPVTWAFPAGPGRAPVLLDYATSAASIGKVQLARAEGKPIPAGWIIDAAGRPSTAPEDLADGGWLLPFGAHKGYALGVIAELLAVGLSAGERFRGRERSSCLFVLAIAPDWFRPADELFEFVEATVARIKSVPALVDGEEVLAPGDPELQARRGATSILLPDAVWQELCGAERQLKASGQKRTS